MVHSYLVMKNKPLYIAFEFLSPLSFGYDAKIMRTLTDSDADVSDRLFRSIHSPTLAIGQTL
ncbi:hypothetical protein AADEFJLK_01612 [Methylovulum psychrotolerans]|uniref:Uncharacterized protein n=1 Tax=Methylovulum psychrotolerans TaxID=1704499 RepID=A0A2S5CN24_9GAMM|nr:hypothetical protein AADEFJLK_01612 [Methylovulum psychrotolerans]